MMMTRMMMAGALALACAAPAMAERRPAPKTIDVDGTFECQQALERAANRDARWLSWNRWPIKIADPDRAGGFVLAGDEVEMQAPNGNWFRMSYVCKWHPTGSAKAGVVGFGRLQNAFR